MKLQIQPEVALCDERVGISISELPPGNKVKISASLSLPWAKDVVFESCAWFTADLTGSVDLSKQKPDAGSYDYIDSMGLIDSVRSHDPKVMEKIARNISVSEKLFIDIVAECGQERASARLERSLKSSDVQCERISADFVGELYYSTNPQNKTVVWLGGSGSGLGINSLVCAALASHGFNVLSVSFFGDQGLPAQLSRIPLEYFEQVFAWLSNNPITVGKDIQILGMSKGAELALNIELKTRWVFADMLSCMIKNRPFRFAPTYARGIAAAKNREDARIKVENAQADLLLFTTKDCGMWNSYDGCVEIMDTLRQHNYRHAYDLVVYENGGEPYFVPYVIPVGLNSAKLAPRLVLTTGGTLKGNAQARLDSWQKAIEFLKN